MKNKLTRLSSIAEELEILVRKEDQLKFLEQHHPMLFNMRPIQLLETEEGAKAVARLLEAIETGSFA